MGKQNRVLYFAGVEFPISWSIMPFCDYNLFFNIMLWEHQRIYTCIVT